MLYKYILIFKKKNAIYFSSISIGLGTNNEDLIRIIVSRCEIDLNQIKKEYLRLYGKTLYDAVKSELSGDYEVYYKFKKNI